MTNKDLKNESQVNMNNKSKVPLLVGASAIVYFMLKSEAQLPSNELFISYENNEVISYDINNNEIMVGIKSIDDTEVIQNAVDIADVITLNNIFQTDNSIEIGDNTTFQGVNLNTCGLKLKDDAECELIKNIDQINGNSDIYIKTIQLNGNKQNQNGTKPGRIDYSPLEFGRVKNSVVESCYVHDGYGGAGIGVSNCENISILNNEVRNCGTTTTQPGVSDSIFISGRDITVKNNITGGSTDTGIAVDWGADNVIVENNMCDGDYYGIQLGGNSADIVGVQNVTIKNNIIKNTIKDFHLNINNFGSNMLPTNISVLDNIFIGNGEIRIGNYNIGYIDNIKFNGNELINNMLNDYTIKILASTRIDFKNNILPSVYFYATTSSTEIYNNTIKNGYYTGLHILGGNDINIYNNTILNSNQSLLEYESAETNGISLRDSPRLGVIPYTPLSRCNIHNNIIDDSQAFKTMLYNLWVASGDNIIVENNDLYKAKVDYEKYHVPVSSINNRYYE